MDLVKKFAFTGHIVQLMKAKSISPMIHTKKESRMDIGMLPVVYP